METSEAAGESPERVDLSFLQRMRGGFGEPPPYLALFAFLLHLLLIFPILFPNLRDLGPFDEMIYLNGGRALAGGSLPSFASNPLLSGFYALLYLPAQRSPFWIVHLASFGRLILFSLMWLGAYLVARRFTRYASPLILVGFLIVSPVLTELLLNPSDAAFAALSALSFWQVLRFKETGRYRNAILGSAFVGLATLARNDGLALIPLFAVLIVTFSLAGERSAVRTLVSLAAALLPFTILVGGYILLHGRVTGEVDLGLSRRAYQAFEQGHPAPSPASGGNPTLEAQEAARRVYGSPQENDYSILNAIRRNPGAFRQRLRGIVSGLPADLLGAYHKRLAAVIFLFALRGVLALLKRGSLLMLASLLVWPLHLAVYFLTFFRTGYLLLPFFALFTLSAIGLSASLSNYGRLLERLLMSFALLGLAVYGVVDEKLAITAGAAVFLLGIWAVWYLLNFFSGEEPMHAVGLVVMLALGVVVRGDYPSFQIRTLGEDPEEQALVFMAENLEPGSTVGAYAPGHTLAAGMRYFGLASRGVSFESDEDLHAWLVEQDVAAIYSTSILRNREPELWALIEAGIGENFERAFRKDPRDIQVILVLPPEDS